MMTLHRQIRLNAADYYLLRTPRISWNAISELNAIGSVEDMRMWLFELYTCKDQQEAIRLSSKVLHLELIKWLENGPHYATEKLLLSLYKYTLRMGTRPTPFGLHASVCLGEVSTAASSMVLSGEGCAFCRLDMGFSHALAKEALSCGQFKDAMRYNVNSSLYETKDVFCFYKYSLTLDGRIPQLVTLAKIPSLSFLLRFAQNGVAYAELVEKLMDKGLAANPAKAIVDKLIEDQVLVSELEPNVTGREYDQVLRHKVKESAIKCEKLEAIGQLVDAARCETPVLKKLGDISTLLGTSFLGMDPPHLLQVDHVMKTFSNQVNENVFSTIAKELGDLAPINQAALPDGLLRFKKDFAKRYGDRVMPLMEALDIDMGIGYERSDLDFRANNVLLEGIDGTHAKEGSVRLPLQLMLDKLRVCVEGSDGPVELTREDLLRLGNPDKQGIKCPAGLAVMGTLLAKDSQGLDRGNFSFHLKSCGGHSSIPLMARFAHAIPKLGRKLASAFSAEQRFFKCCILAEVVHMPEARLGNILQRPDLAPYEIPVMGNSLKPVDRQISLSDLRVSIRNDQVVLWSHRLGKRVIPRLNNAHNFSHGIAAYRFLADLQSQDAPFALHWDWKELDERPYLPRVFYKHIILSRARWLLGPNEVEGWDLAGETCRWQEFMRQYGLPQKVLLGDGDNELLIDLSNPLARKLLAQRLAKGRVRLHECLCDKGNCPVKNDQSHPFVHELIVPFIPELPDLAVATASPERNEPVGLPRTFLPGSEWIYMKLYGGPKSADGILIGHVRGWMEELMATRCVRKWFFIRYNDPDPHIRLRILAEGQDLIAVLSRIHGYLQPRLLALMDSKMLYRVQQDTYEREIERYFAKTIESAETFFHADSHFALSVLHVADSCANEDLRWLSALASIDQLLHCSGFDLRDKRRIVCGWREAFFAEFGDNGKLNHQLNESYRSRKHLIAKFLDGTEMARHPVLERAFSKRQGELLPILTRSKEVHAQEQGRMEDLLASFSHMSINRLFLSEQRLQELVLYHYLSKHYAMELAVAANKGRTDNRCASLAYAKLSEQLAPKVGS